MPQPHAVVLRPCAVCGTNIAFYPSHANRAARPTCSSRCLSALRATVTGPIHPSWRGGRKRTRGHYVLLWVGKKQPMATSQGYVFEHRLVMSQYLKRPLRPEERVHHINGKRNDNRLSNLVFCSSQREHMQHHPGSGIRCACSEKALAKGLCRRCYRRAWQQRTKKRYLRKPSRILCRCGRPQIAKGLCGKHYQTERHRRILTRQALSPPRR